jgi:RNA recognition motif-containing protein
MPTNSEKLKNRIYVGNLHKNVKSSDLFTIFSPFGRILTVQKRNPTYAFIEFENEEFARMAIKRMNGNLFYSKQIVVNRVICDKKKVLTHFSNGTDGIMQSEI